MADRHDKGELLQLIASELDPVDGENLRETELRKQARNDPLIWSAAIAGIPRTEIASAAGVSTTAIHNSLARTRRLRDETRKPVDWDATMAQLESEKAKLEAVIEALRPCLPFLRGR